MQTRFHCEMVVADSGLSVVTVVDDITECGGKGMRQLVDLGAPKSATTRHEVASGLNESWELPRLVVGTGKGEDTRQGWSQGQVAHLDDERAKGEP